MVYTMLGIALGVRRSKVKFMFTRSYNAWLSGAVSLVGLVERAWAQWTGLELPPCGFQGFEQTHSISWPDVVKSD